jgi:tRNA(fMet)-specific endonuclease VapC
MMDTNTVSYMLRAKSLNARRKLAALADDEVGCISAITEAELRYGVEKRGTDAQRTALELWLGKVQILPWGSEESKVYGRMRAELERSGRMLGNMDLLIAAHAASVGAVLVTNDNAFKNLEGLKEAPHATVNWATDLYRKESKKSDEATTREN